MRPIDRLLSIMERLRDPDGGCPWDVEQTFATIAPYTIEEAYEVADAIERNDLVELKGELGDLLFQVVFHARMAEEQGLFAFDDVANAIADKLERRHPHVFGDEAAKADGAAQKARWEDIKAVERAAKAQTGVLDDVPVVEGLPGRRQAERQHVPPHRLAAGRHRDAAGRKHLHRADNRFSGHAGDKKSGGPLQRRRRAVAAGDRAASRSSRSGVRAPHVIRCR